MSDWCDLPNDGPSPNHISYSTDYHHVLIEPDDLESLPPYSHVLTHFPGGRSPDRRESPEPQQGFTSGLENLVVDSYPQAPLYADQFYADSVCSETRSSSPHIDTGRWLPPITSYMMDAIPQSLDGGGFRPLDSSGLYTCADCGQSYPSAQRLEAHAKAREHKSYQCTEKECGKLYRRRDTLVRHKAVHKPSERHPCQVCHRNNEKKTFTRKDHLLQHMRTRHLPETYQLYGGEFL